jgi:ketosteroid isomerase-like protein
MRIDRLRKLAVLSGVVLAAALAAAADNMEVMKPVHQFVDGFNKGDAKTVVRACAAQTAIIDDFAPHQWQSCSAWAQAWDAEAKKSGITDAVVTLGKPVHVDVTGDRAYVVVPATFTFKENGKPMKEGAATFTLVLQKGTGGWLITAWSWGKS